MKEQLKEYTPTVLMSIVAVGIIIFVGVQVLGAVTQTENVENGRIRVNSIEPTRYGYLVDVGVEVHQEAFAENVPEYVEEYGWYRADYEIVGGSIERITDWHGTAHGWRMDILYWILGISIAGLSIAVCLRYFGMNGDSND